MKKKKEMPFRHVKFFYLNTQCNQSDVEAEIKIIELICSNNLVVKISSIVYICLDYIYGYT